MRQKEHEAMNRTQGLDFLTAAFYH
uniref:Uncharacterized protein n=1 Tax=Arundo donax TaxID=35708 RepID=A0A0A8YYR7_ARUDO